MPQFADHKYAADRLYKALTDTLGQPTVVMRRSDLEILFDLLDQEYGREGDYDDDGVPQKLEGGMPPDIYLF